MKSVVVVGSANVDLVYRVASLPVPGETVLASSATRHPGGKGNNQVIAVARAGAPATFIASIGADSGGDDLVATLAAAGVSTVLRRPATATGTALITVDDGAENTIVVDSGANAELVDLTADERAVIGSADVLLLQLEVPMATVFAAADIAHRAGATVVLNAAPSQPLSEELLALVDVLVVNEVEAEALGEVARAVVASWVITRGSLGAVVSDETGREVAVPAPEVDAVDTTGAGDTFCGALVAAMCDGRDLVEATRFAVVAGALATQRLGAVSSIPDRREIDEFLPPPRSDDQAPTEDATPAAFVDPLVPRPIDRWTEVPLEPQPDLASLDDAKIFGAPAASEDWPGWRTALRTWSDDATRRCAVDRSAYDDPATAWASRCYSVAVVWLWDERLFDHDSQRFTPESFFAATRDYGGFDAVVLWHAYPIIGIDDRNQFDFYRDLADGALAGLVDWLRQHGIRVFVDYNPWDTGGHSRGLDHVVETAALVTETGADGVFLDTMSEGGAELVAALRSLSPRAVLEGESRVTMPRLTDHQISWAQWFADTPVPGVLRAHWFERRHMQHHTRRWNHDHSDELQSSWMNGTGIVVWDAVFGSWVGWNERDRTTLRAMLRAQRALADVLNEGDWTPLLNTAPEAVAAGVYVSRWQLGDITLWTAINRRTTDFGGPLIGPDAGGPSDRDGQWLDVTSGTDLRSGGDDVRVPARGVTGVVRVTGRVPAELTDLVAAAARDPGSRATDFPARQSVRQPTPRSTTTAAPPTAVVPSPGRRQLAVRYRRRETGMYDGAPFVEEWKPLPPRLHAECCDDIEVEIGAIAVADVEVTNAEFARFVVDTAYQPIVTHRFLRHLAQAPERAAVTHISLDDARAYAAWVGARLPTEHEWQVAATEPGFRRADPLVWNWTESEHTDGVTRFAILKGGCAYHATESEWYFDGGPQAPEFSAKLLLAGLGVERSASIGFRLAWDLTVSAERHRLSAELKEPACGRTEDSSPIDRPSRIDRQSGGAGGASAPRTPRRNDLSTRPLT